MRFLYPGFRAKALTFSYDDGCVQDRRLAALFREYGVKGTFNLNTETLGEKCRINHDGFDVLFDKVEEAELSETYRGMEIAGHTARHLAVASPDQEEVERQLEADAVNVERITGLRPRGFAYPAGPYNHRSPGVLKKHGYVYGRTVLNTYNFSIPQVFHFWAPTAHDRDPQLPALCRRFVAESPEELYCLYIWGHSFELDKNDIDRWAMMRSHLETLAHHEDIWYATNLEICDYIRATRACTFEDGVLTNPTGQTLYLLHRGAEIILPAGESLRL